MDDLEQERRETARWQILRVLDAGRPIGVNGAIIMRICDEEKLLMSPDELRRELSYLAELGLLVIGDPENEEESYAKLTAAGVAVVEYTAPAPAGVARPRKSMGTA